MGKVGNFIKIFGKIPDIFVLITGHFGLFKYPTLRLGEADKTQTQSQTRRLDISKTDFKSVRKTILKEHGTRDFLLFLMGINIGLRISDILKLKVGDVIKQDYIEIRNRKLENIKDFQFHKHLKKY